MNEQAKLLLSAYRPGGADATDPAFAQALAQAQRDPQLRAWLEESQRFDEAITAKLRVVAVPPTLRATILAGAKFSRPRRWWQRMEMWAVAALLAVLATIFAVWPRNGAPLASWQTDSLAVLDQIEAGTEHLDKLDPQPAHLVDWLREHAAPTPSALPPALVARTTFGCKTIDSHGRTVSLICFDLGGKDQAHLFTTTRAGLKFEPPQNHPIFSHRNHWNLASWRSGEDIHMLATLMDHERLRALIPSSLAARNLPQTLFLGELLTHP